VERGREYKAVCSYFGREAEAGPQAGLNAS
jgi:hypothetical protein